VDRCDVVVVGGGIAGSALAVALAEDGLDVVVLEASTEYVDRVRGESMMPWGVAEARELGVERALMDAGAHRATTWLHYDGSVPLEKTLAHPIPVGMMVPGIEGSLNLRHPEACATLAATASAAGARVLRGVADVKARPGAIPTVAYNDRQGRSFELEARLIVGADGRRSSVRAASGLELQRQGETHLVAGLLVDGLDELDGEPDFLAAEGEFFMAGFWQQGGRMRVYLMPGLSQRHRFSGRDGLEEFLRCCAFECLPFGDRLAASRAAGPVATYPGDDSWIDQPFVEGVVLIGDAAGYNDPIIGQGLSIAMRDARIVRDIIRSGDLGSGFEDYGHERLERMRRLRHVAAFMSLAMANDGDDRLRRRERFFELQTSEPLFLGLMGAALGGPESAPAEAFDGRLLAALRGEQPA
jgi:menaquinone-9 beta-reductase